MKTLDEVIKAYECCNHDDRCEDCPYNGITCTLERNTDALHYLKTIEITENLYHDAVNKLSKWEDEDWKDRCLPLTWDELKQMAGKPVWIESEHVFIFDEKTWVLIRLDTEDDDWIFCVSTKDNMHYEFAISKEDYDTDWQAYRKENNGK